MQHIQSQKFVLSWLSPYWPLTSLTILAKVNVASACPKQKGRYGCFSAHSFLLGDLLSHGCHHTDPVTYFGNIVFATAWHKSLTQRCWNWKWNNFLIWPIFQGYVKSLICFNSKICMKMCYIFWYKLDQDEMRSEFSFKYGLQLSSYKL